MKGHGFNLELEREHSSHEDDVFGALSQPAVINISEDKRLESLPVGEEQKGKEDMQDCASRAPINKLEADFTYGLRNKLFVPANDKWLRDNGFVRDGDRVVFSDAFIAILSGTTRAGNSLKAPLQAIHDYGLIPKTMLPFSPNMTWAEYHDPKRITPAMKRLGEEFKKCFEIRYEKVYEVHYGELLKDEMLIVAGYAWPTPAAGVYPRIIKEPNHAWLNVKLPKYVAFDNYRDSNGEYIKTLAPDFDFLEYGYRVFIKAQTATPEEQISIMKQLVILLGRLLGFVQTNPNYKPTDTVPEVPAVPTKPVEPPKPSMREKIYQEGRRWLGKDASPVNQAPQELACVESVCYILREAGVEVPMMISTIDFSKWLRATKLFRATNDPKPGNIILSVTGSGNGSIVGHTGIFSQGGRIMSNDSAIGMWLENYTIDTWVKRWREKGGMKIYYYEINE